MTNGNDASHPNPGGSRCVLQLEIDAHREGLRIDQRLVAKEIGQIIAAEDRK